MPYIRRGSSGLTAQPRRSTGTPSTPCSSTSTACSRRPPTSTSGHGSRCSTRSSRRGRTAGAGSRSAATTISPTSTASGGSTACVRSSPRGASTCRRGPSTTHPATTPSTPSATPRTTAFQQVLRRDGIEPYPGVGSPARRPRRRGIAVGVVSSSRNAVEVLDAAGLADRFEVVVDGNVAAARNLPGKPAPDTFLLAAEQLGRRRRSAPPSSRTPSPAWPPAMPGASRWRSASIGVPATPRSTEHGADVVVDDLDELLPTVPSRAERT